MNSTFAHLCEPYMASSNGFAPGKTHSWQAMFEAFAQTKTEDGLFEFPRDMMVQGKNLYQWLESQTAFDLPQRTQKFLEIGFDIKSFENLSILPPNHLPQSMTVTDYSSTEDKASEKESSSSQVHAAEDTLHEGNRLGAESSLDGDLKWENMFCTLLEFRNEEEGCFEITGPKQNMLLDWISQQRRLYYNLAANHFNGEVCESDNLLIKKFKKLASIGLDLDPDGDAARLNSLSSEEPCNASTQFCQLPIKAEMTVQLADKVFDDFRHLEGLCKEEAEASPQTQPVRMVFKEEQLQHFATICSPERNGLSIDGEKDKASNEDKQAMMKQELSRHDEPMRHAPNKSANSLLDTHQAPCQPTSHLVFNSEKALPLPDKTHDSSLKLSIEQGCLIVRDREDGMDQAISIQSKSSSPEAVGRTADVDIKATVESCNSIPKRKYDGDHSARIGSDQNQTNQKESGKWAGIKDACPEPITVQKRPRKHDSTLLHPETHPLSFQPTEKCFPFKRQRPCPNAPMLDAGNLPHGCIDWIKARGGKGGSDCSHFRQYNFCKKGRKCRRFHYLNSSVSLSNHLKREYRCIYFPSQRQDLEKFVHVWEKQGADKAYFTAGYRNKNFIVLAKFGNGMKQRDGRLWWYATKEEAKNAVFERIRDFT